MTTQRLAATLLGLFVAVMSFAAHKDLNRDITMVSYEQRWMDRNGTLALKNNSNVEVKNVVFLITYLDMKGNALDYEEYAKPVNIAPGMTRKLDIPAYEREREYHYYKSEGGYSSSPSFKIKFQLKDYNVTADETIEDSSTLWPIHDQDNEMLYVAIAIVVVLFVIGITIGLYVLVAVMAQKRQRNVVAWILLSLLTTPFLMILILLAIGESEKYVDDY